MSLMTGEGTRVIIVNIDDGKGCKRCVVVVGVAVVGFVSVVVRGILSWDDSDCGWKRKEMKD